MYRTFFSFFNDLVIYFKLVIFLLLTKLFMMIFWKNFNLKTNFDSTTVFCMIKRMHCFESLQKWQWLFDIAPKIVSNCIPTESTYTYLRYLRLFRRNSTRSSHAVTALADGPLQPLLFNCFFTYFAVWVDKTLTLMKLVSWIH